MGRAGASWAVAEAKFVAHPHDSWQAAAGTGLTARLRPGRDVAHDHLPTMPFLDAVCRLPWRSLLPRSLACMARSRACPRCTVAIAPLPQRSATAAPGRTPPRYPLSVRTRIPSHGEKALRSARERTPPPPFHSWDRQWSFVKPHPPLVRPIGHSQDASSRGRRQCNRPPEKGERPGEFTTGRPKRPALR